MSCIFYCLGQIFSLDTTFFQKREILLILRGYIKVIQRLEIFLASARTAHNLKETQKEYDTLTTIDPKTRPHPCVR